MNEIFRLTKDNITLITYPVGEFAANCTMVINETTKETFIFDPGFRVEPNLEIIQNNELTPTKLIHTHGHFDHITCSSELKRKTGAKILIHLADEFLLKDLNSQAAMFGVMVNIQAEAVDRHIDEGDQIQLEENGPEFLTIHTPGHSEGGCCFYTDFFDTPLIIAGDTLFQQSIGRTDLPGGNHAQLLSSIKNKLLTYPDETIVICGHGPTTTIGAEKKYNMFLK